jgi:hypothetical protein
MHLPTVQRTRQPLQLPRLRQPTHPRLRQRNSQHPHHPLLLPRTLQQLLLWRLHHILQVLVKCACAMPLSQPDCLKMKAIGMCVLKKTSDAGAAQ